MNDATADKTPADQWRQLDFSSAEKAAESLAFARRIMPTTGLGAHAYNVEFELGAERDWSAMRLLNRLGLKARLEKLIRRASAKD